MTCICGHTVWPKEIKFGSETTSHLQIAQTNFQPRTPTLGSEGSKKWFQRQYSLNAKFLWKNLKTKIAAHPWKWGMGQIRSGPRPHPGVRQQVQIQEAFPDMFPWPSELKLWKEMGTHPWRVIVFVWTGYPHTQGHGAQIGLGLLGFGCCCRFGCCSELCSGFGLYRGFGICSGHWKWTRQSQVPPASRRWR